MTANTTRETLDPSLFALPPDHVVVALRARTGYEHLGWRKPSRAERLRCAALLASDDFDRLRADLTPVELSVLQPTSPLADSARLRRLLDVVDQNPAVQGGVKVLAGIQAAQELLAWLTAVQATQLARLAEPGCCGDPTDLAHAAARIDPDLSDAEPESVHWALAGTQLAVGHLGAGLCISPISAGYRISDAQDLVENLPDLHAALAAGTVDPTRARILQQRTKVLDRLDDRRNAVNAVLRIAMRHNPGRVATLIDAAVIQVDPDAAEQRHRDAVDRRGLRVDKLEDGMAKFIAQLPATDAQLALDLFDSIAEGLKGFDDRCAAHRRADAFTTLIELLAAGHTVSAETLLHQALTTTCTCHPTEAGNDGAATAADHGSAAYDVRPATARSTPAAHHATASPCGPTAENLGHEAGVRKCVPDPDVDRSDAGDHPAAAAEPAGKRWSLPTRQGRRTHATVVLPWETFCRLDGTVAELVDYGTITAAWGRTLLEAASTVTLLVSDPATGRAVGVGERTYRPKQDVRDKVTTAYPTCIFTGCSRSSRLCDCEHCLAFDHRHPERGGATNTANLYPVCRLHHRLKTFGHWGYEAHPDGVHVTSPLGQTTVSSPKPDSVWYTPPSDSPPPF